LELNIPPLIFPCVSLTGQPSTFPSIIIGPDIQLVSNVVIEGPDNPVQILHSTVTIIGGFSLPSVIFFDMPTIVIDPPIPPSIVMVPPSTVAMTFTEVPKLEVNWASIPNLEVQLTMARTVKPPKLMAQTQDIKNEFGDEFADLFDASEHLKIEYETVGIPSEIKVIAPDIKIDGSDIPRTIKIITEDAKIPDFIKIFGPDKSLPENIYIHGPEIPLPTQINIVSDIPSQIGVISDIPHEITIKMEKEIPSRILIELTDPIPTRITIDASGIPTNLPVTGIPKVIEVTGFPSSIPISFPKEEDMPKMELVYKGAPIEMKITMDKIISNSMEDRTRVQIIPCIPN